MYLFRKAQEHDRNVELYLYRKIGLLVRLSIPKLKKKVERTNLLVDQTYYSALKSFLLSDLGLQSPPVAESILQAPNKPLMPLYFGIAFATNQNTEVICQLFFYFFPMVHLFEPILNYLWPYLTPYCALFCTLQCTNVILHCELRVRPA